MDYKVYLDQAVAFAKANAVGLIVGFLIGALIF